MAAQPFKEFWKMWVLEIPVRTSFRISMEPILNYKTMWRRHLQQWPATIGIELVDLFHS